MPAFTTERCADPLAAGVVLAVAIGALDEQAHGESEQKRRIAIIAGGNGSVKRVDAVDSSTQRQFK
jgi:hypothetical protein